MDASQRIEDLLFLTTNLAELLEEENAALKNDRLDVVKGLIERKTTLSRAYEIRIFGMKQDQDTAEYTELDLANIARLEEVGTRVAELIIENEKMLKVALEVSRRFMDCVAESVKQSTPGTGAYGSTGISSPQTHAAQKQAASLALDETL